MSNTTIKISLPTSLKNTLQRLAKKNQYNTVSGFVQQLIRQEDTLSKEKKKLQKMLQAGLESGQSNTPPETFFAELNENLNDGSL